MRIILVILALLLPISPASANDWTHVSANHHASYFVDRSSIKIVEDYVLFWDMGNLFGPIGDGIVAVKSYNQADCKNFLVKTLKTSFHKQPMAADNVTVQEATNKKWKKPALNSAAAKILKFVCGRESRHKLKRQ